MTGDLGGITKARCTNTDEYRMLGRALACSAARNVEGVADYAIARQDAQG